MRTIMRSVFAAAALATAGLAAQGAAAQQQPTEVDLELVLAVDVSSSVDPGEFALQRDGWANAFRNSAIQDAIDAGTRGQIAASLVYWSSANAQQVSVPWTLLGDGTNGSSTASGFGDAIAGAPRPFGGATGVGSAIDFSANELENNDFAGERRVIDVSGDGTNNSGRPAALARDDAADLGITINGLAIETGGPGLANYFEAQVQTSDGFTLGVEGFDDIESAALTKLQTEIGGGGEFEIPAPPAAFILLAGLLGLFGMSRRAQA